MNRIASLSIVLGLSLSAVAQWNIVNHPGFQAVKSVTTQGSDIYMVAYPSGVIKSTNGGGSWAAVNTGLPAGTAVHSVFSAGAILLCGTESGVYRSTNGGASWSLSNTGLPISGASNYAKKFFQFGSTTLAVYSATLGGGGGIFRSTDGGQQWFSGNNGLATNMTVYQVAQAGSLLYAATSAGLTNSSNLAVTWNQMPSANFACFAVQGTASRLVVISGLGYRFSTNGGGSWSNGTGALPTSPTAGELILYDSKYWAITGPNQNDVVRSTDNGATWSQYETGLQNADVIAQNCFHAAGTTLYLGCFSNLYTHPGTTTDLEERIQERLPLPYPTAFQEGFSFETGADWAGGQALLIDASGREAHRERGLPSGTAWIARGSLVAGSYRVILIDRTGSQQRLLGTVIAQ